MAKALEKLASAQLDKKKVLYTVIIIPAKITSKILLERKLSYKLAPINAKKKAH